MIRTVSVLQFVCLAEERVQQNTAAAAAGHRTVLSRPADSLSWSGAGSSASAPTQTVPSALWQGSECRIVIASLIKAIIGFGLLFPELRRTSTNRWKLVWITGRYFCWGERLGVWVQEWQKKAFEFFRGWSVWWWGRTDWNVGAWGKSNTAAGVQSGVFSGWRRLFNNCEGAEQVRNTGFHSDV